MHGVKLAFKVCVVLTAAVLVCFPRMLKHKCHSGASQTVWEAGRPVLRVALQATGGPAFEPPAALVAVGISNLPVCVLAPSPRTAPAPAAHFSSGGRPQAGALTSPHTSPWAMNRGVL